MASSLTNKCTAVPVWQLGNKSIAGLGACRQFSLTSRRCDDSKDPDPPRRPFNANFDQAARRENTKSLLRGMFNKSSSPSSNRPIIRSSQPRSQPDPINARFSGRDTNAAPQKTLSLRNLPHGNKLAGRRGPNQGLFAAANALSRKRTSARDRGPQRRRKFDPFEEDEEEGDADPETLAYERELEEKERRFPVRYNPEPYSVEKLRPTWPTLPITGGDSTIANAGAVMDQLNWMGDRYLNAYDPTPELAQRMYDGKRVMFKSEEEKAEVLDLVQKMVAERAQKLTERKGEVVAPEEAAFESVSAQEKKDLIQTMVQGTYDKPLVEDEKATGAPVVAHVLRNLKNNGTYQGLQAEQFVKKFMKGLPSRLVKSENKAA